VEPSNFKRVNLVQVLKAETEATKEGELMFPEEDQSLNWGMPNVEDQTCEEPLGETQGTKVVEHAQADYEFRAVAVTRILKANAKRLACCHSVHPG